METGGLLGGANQFFEWIRRFSFVNVLWILFSLSGLIVIGLFPATAAMFFLFNKWQSEKSDISIFKTFLKAFKLYFFRANIMGIVLVLWGFVIYFYFNILYQLDGILLLLVNVGVLILTIAYLIVLLNIFQVIVQYQLKTFQSIKIAFFMGISNLHWTTFNAISVLAVSLVVAAFPVLGFFFSGSTLSFLLVWGTIQAISRVNKKKEQIVL